MREPFKEALKRFLVIARSEVINLQELIEDEEGRETEDGESSIDDEKIAELEEEHNSISEAIESLENLEGK